MFEDWRLKIPQDFPEESSNSMPDQAMVGYGGTVGWDWASVKNF